MIKPKDKDKFKTIDEYLCKKNFCPGRIKKIVKRKEHIVVETDTIGALEKPKNSTEIRRKFTLEEVNRVKP